MGPVHELRNDQEISRKVHLYDDIEFVLKAFPIRFRFRGHIDCLQAIREPVSGHPLQEFRFILRKVRENWLLFFRPIGNPPGDIHRVGKRFGKVREQFPHFLRGVEPVLRRVPCFIGLLPGTPASDAAKDSVRS